MMCEKKRSHIMVAMVFSALTGVVSMMTSMDPAAPDTDASSDMST